MNCTDELRARVLAPPSPDEVARRRRVVDEIKSLRASIVPLTVPEFRRLAREDEEATYDHGRGVGS